MIGFFRKSILCRYVDVAKDDFWYGFLDHNVFNRIGAVDGISRMIHNDNVYRVMDVIAECNDKDHDALIYLKYECPYSTFFFKRVQEVKDGTDHLSRADKKAERYRMIDEAQEGFCIPV